MPVLDVGMELFAGFFNVLTVCKCISGWGCAETGTRAVTLRQKSIMGSERPFNVFCRYNRVTDSYANTINVQRQKKLPLNDRVNLMSFFFFFFFCFNFF